MGQTPSKDQQFAELYSSYIQQQQNLIYQQQQQINSLFNNNLQGQMMQQQMMMQQQQMMMQQQKKEETKEESESILEAIQSEWKTVLIVFVLTVSLNMGAVDDLLKTDTLGFFVDETGNLTIQSVVMKAVAVSILFFVIHKFVPL